MLRSLMKGRVSALANQAQGVTAFTADDVDVLVSRITQPGR